MSRSKPRHDAFGCLCQPGGRQITVQAPYLEWMAWAQRALDVHEDMLAALKGAQFAFGFGSSATPKQQQAVAEAITAAIAKALGGRT